MFVELLPIIALVVLATVYLAVLVYKFLCLSRKKGHLHGHLPQVSGLVLENEVTVNMQCFLLIPPGLLQLVSSVIVMFRVLYIYLTRMSLDVFNCVPTSPPGALT